MTTSNDSDKVQEPISTPADTSSVKTTKESIFSNISKSSSLWQLPKLPNVQATITDLPKRISEMKIPTHWEEHLESGVIKAILGASVGGAIGLVLFKSGSGWRSACMAVGVGAAVGNTYERIVQASAEQKPK